jgi:hypothetical protein
MLTTTKTKPFIKIYDDLIPEYLQNYIEQVTLGRCETGGEDDLIFPTVEFTCKYESTAKTIDNSTPMSFVHMLKSSCRLSPHLENFGLIPQAICAHNDLLLKDILVGRIYITVPHNTDQKNYEPHTDLPFDHMVVLYYVNDADGETVFFDDNNNIIQSVEPKKGRAVLFDGKILHGGGIPTKGPRCIVNYDIQVIKG